MQQFCVPCGFSFHKIGRPTVVPSSSVILDLGCWYPPPLSLANLWVALFTLGFSALQLLERESPYVHCCFCRRVADGGGSHCVSEVRVEGGGGSGGVLGFLFIGFPF